MQLLGRGYCLPLINKKNSPDINRYTSRYTHTATKGFNLSLFPSFFGATLCISILISLLKLETLFNSWVFRLSYWWWVKNLVKVLVMVNHVLLLYKVIHYTNSLEFKPVFFFFLIGNDCHSSYKVVIFHLKIPLFF